MPSPPNLFIEPDYILTMPHIPEVERCILGLALRFALLGRVDTARRLTELLYSRPKLQNLSNSGLDALVVYWRLTQFPTAIPEELKSDAYFNEYVKSKDSEGLRWPFYVQPENRTEDETGLNMILSPGLNNPNYNEREPERGPALELAVKLAERRNVDPLVDPKVKEILATLSRHSIDTWQDSFLVGSPRCAPIFMSGAMARALNISDEELDSRAAEILEASRQRYWHGRSSQRPKTISELLQSCNDDTVARSDSHWIEMEEPKPTSLYKQSASEEQIANLEEKLGVSLPEDFKAFLHISNGFGAESSGFGGIWNGYFPGPPLRSVDEIDWLDYSQYELQCYQMTVFSLHDFPESDKIPEPPTFANVICIASEEIYDIWLIPPEMMKQMRDYYKEIYAMVNDDGKRIIERAVDDFAGSWDKWEKLDWGCVSWACGGSAQLDCFKSFTAWLEDAAWTAKYAGREDEEEA
ncbi:hypothetical protein QM012_007460 [Aureobasidium pullulans]|uniref:Knr4/Smi1-like domain-containing protein n=1 Tax=Aureobasidium pullulans TaxID=5580 RepID=A0ABR0TN04_AURPU